MFRSTLRGYGVGLGVNCVPYPYLGYNSSCYPMPGQQMPGYPMYGHQAHGHYCPQPGVAYPVQDTTPQRPFRGGRG